MQGAPTYDYESEQAAIARQMKLAEIAAAQGAAPMGPTEMVSGIAVPQSPLQGVAKLVQAYMGRRGIEEAESRRKQLGERYRADLSSGISRFIDGISTQPGEQPAQTGNNPSAYVAPQQFSPEDARGARLRTIVEAMGSNHPVLQQLGASQLSQMQKGNIEAKDLLPYADPAAIPGMVRTGAVGFKPKRNIKEVGGVVYDADTLDVLQLKDGYNPAEERLIGGDRYQVNPSTRKMEKMDNAPKVSLQNVGNVVNRGQLAGFEEWSKAAAKRVSEMSEQATAARNLVSRTNQLEALTTAGTNAGPLADAATFLQGLANQTGIKVDASKLANSQTFESESTRAWAEMMQSLGGARGLVKEESEKIARSLPSMVQTPQGRAQIISLIRQAAEQQISDAERANQEYGKALEAQSPSMFSFGLSKTILPQSGTLPSAPGSTSPGKPIVKNW
jgi:hypothetical protein